MTSVIFYACIFIVVLYFQPQLIRPSLCDRNKVEILSPAFFTERTAQNGYFSEEHTTVTEDGYILKIHRIVQAKHCKRPKRHLPVILMHGLLQSSDTWIDAGKQALGYLLADTCYDLWVGNQRGNYYSRRHKYLDPDKDSKFWKFSSDEIGMFDIPATIDYVLNRTGAGKVNYIGFSQGSGTVYIMCSERPKYCDKIHVFISLAPATRLLNTKSVAFRKIAGFIETFKDILEISGFNEVFSRDGVTQNFLSSICRFITVFKKLCAGVLFSLDSSHPGSITSETLQVLFQHFLAGTSVNTMVRYSQSLRNTEFVKMNYGKQKNMKTYGSELPPAYNLSAVTVPVVIIYGKNDGLVDSKDVRWLVNRLPHVLEAYEVTDPEWTHFDVCYSQYINETIFPKINEYLEKYSYI